MSMHRLGFMLLVLLAASALRTVNLSELPPGPHYDEAANIIITRTVAYGGARPFPMVENYQGREVLYYYLSAPFVMGVHDSRFALQVVGVLGNVVMVAATMALARAMFPGRRGEWVALAAGVVAAISLPQVLLARQAFRAITLPAMQALTLLLLWRGLRSQRRVSWVWLLTAGVLGGLTVYTYNSSRLFPVWLAIGGVALLVFSAGERLHRLKQGAAFFVPLALVALPFALYAVQKPDIFFGRLYEVTGTGSDVSLTESVWLHARMFFVHGETLLRYNPRGRPYFTPIEGIFLLAGLAAALWTIVRPNPPLVRAACVLLVLSPLMVLPSVIATGGYPPNHMRSVAMVPLVFILVGFGFERVMLFIRSERFIMGILAATLVAGGATTARDYFAWATRADLYYNTDADLAAAAAWMHDTLPADEPVYVAAQDRFHPTVQVFDTPPVRWLGTNSLFLPPPGSTRRVIFPRSAQPPDEWQAWLSGAWLDDLPLAPDGQTAFTAAELHSDMPLPELAPADETRTNGVLTLLRGTDAIALPNGNVTVVTAWRVEQPPTANDLTPIVQMEDTLGNVIARAEAFSTGTNTWEAGETLLQRVTGLRVPVGTPPGEYALRLTWVERSAERYLPYADSSGAFAGVWVDVGTVEVLRPNTFPPPDDVPMDTRANIDAAPGVRLLGWNTFPQTARPGETLPLTLHWQGIPTQPRTDFAYSVLLGRGDERILLRTDAPLLADHPAGTWLDGQLITDRMNTVLPRELENGQYQLVLQIGTTHVKLNSLFVEGKPKLYTPPTMDHIVSQTFGEQIFLHGYNIRCNDDMIQLELLWQASTSVNSNYTVFIHLVDDNGHILQQRDVMPQSNTYPTSLWSSGEYVMDTHTMPCPNETFSLRVGLYRQADGVRLPLANGRDFFEVRNVNTRQSAHGN